MSGETVEQDHLREASYAQGAPNTIIYRRVNNFIFFCIIFSNGILCALYKIIENNGSLKYANDFIKQN